MTYLESLLKGSGFTSCDNYGLSYSLNIVEDFSLKVVPERGGWQSVDTLATTLSCPRFRLFMHGLLKNTNAKEFSKIAIGERKEGVIGQALVLLEGEERDVSFYTGNGEILVSPFLLRLSKLTKVEELYNVFYLENTNLLLAFLDGIWAQLFFLFNMDLDIRYIYETIHDLPPNFAKPDIKNIDIEALGAFRDEYNRIDGATR